MNNLIVKKPSKTEMCPPGYHIVRGHYRKTKDGKTWVDQHQRKNKSKFKQFPKVDPLLIKAIIAKESSFNPKADPKVAHSSAYGLMQIVDKSRAA